jgi:cytochrome c oxidase subunit IV
MSEHIVARKTYFVIWALLMIFTALTFGISFIDLGPWSAVIAVAIAATKATIIALFFMHIKYADKLTRLVAVAALFWLGIMFVLTGTDFFTRYMGTFAPQ